MAVRRSSKSQKSVSRDPEKECVLKGLSAALQGAGYAVRREKLKRGPGWRVVSGMCRALDQNAAPQRLIFVDRALSQDDQISFLVGRINDLEVSVGADIMTHHSFRLWFDPTEPDDVDVEIAARHKRGSRETPWGGPGYQLPLKRKMYYNAFRVLPQIFKIPQPTGRLAEGEYVSLAGRKWMAIHTPGHTEDHLCLFDADNGVMLCGDHVLPTITPHISGMSKHPDPLAGFFNSLDKVGAFGKQVGISLPAHGKPFADIATRCEQIKEHHMGRLDKLRTAAAELDRPTSVTEFSGHLFSPRAQGTMADSETFAHLEHLRIAGEFSYSVRDGVREYVRIS